MQFSLRQAVIIFTVGALIGSVPSVSEAAFAKALGKKSYGGKLSKSHSLSTQQLTGDPASILKGSMSTEYDPTVVKLIDLIPGPYFDVTALIGIHLDTDGPGVERFASDSAFFAGLPLPYTETGYVQVSFERKAGTTEQSVIDPLPGYILVDSDGTTDGDDTHALFFQGLVPNSSEVASYHIYQEDGTRHAVVPDYLINLDNEIITSDIESATVQAQLPEPTGLGLLATAGFGAMIRRRH